MVDLYNQDPRAFLNMYRISKGKIANMKLDIKRLEEDILKSRTMDGLPRHGGINHPTADAAIKLADKRARYEKEIAEQEQICATVEDVIHSVPDPTLERLLILRYTTGASWKFVADEMHYAKAYVEKELKTKAILEVQKELEQRRERQTI